MNALCKYTDSIEVIYRYTDTIEGGFEVSEPRHYDDLTSYVAAYALAFAGVVAAQSPFSSSAFAPALLHFGHFVDAQQAGLSEYVTAVYYRPESDTRVAMLATESLLAKEWNTPEEDDAWAHL